MTECDEKWNRQCEQLVKFKQTNGHCMVPNKHKQSKSPARWVRNQWSADNNDKIRLDRKERLEESGSLGILTPVMPSNQTTISGTSNVKHMKKTSSLAADQQADHCINVSMVQR
jgi:hypothetical protein